MDNKKEKNYREVLSLTAQLRENIRQLKELKDKKEALKKTTADTEAELLKRKEALKKQEKRNQ